MQSNFYVCISSIVQAWQVAAIAGPNVLHCAVEW